MRDVIKVCVICLIGLGFLMWLTRSDGERYVPHKATERIVSSGTSSDGAGNPHFWVITATGRHECSAAAWVKLKVDHSYVVEEARFHDVCTEQCDNAIQSIIYEVGL